MTTEEAESVALKAGDAFNSFEEVERLIRRYEQSTFVNLYITDSRSVEAFVTKTPNKASIVNMDLKYQRLTYACIRGGRKFIPKSQGRRMTRWLDFIDYRLYQLLTTCA